MVTRYPAEFRERAVELARQREKPVKQLAADLGISDQTLHNWLKQADIDAGLREGLTTEERAAGAPATGEPGAGDGERDPEARGGLLRAREHAPK